MIGEKLEVIAGGEGVFWVIRALGAATDRTHGTLSYPASCRRVAYA